MTIAKEVEITMDEEEAEPEDWCFICKDGGDLILCDYGNCTKVYHTACVQKNRSCSEVEDGWTCDRHVCHRCRETPPSFHCFCCPNSFCENCIRYVKFLVVKDESGLCDECLDLVLLGEEKDPRDSKGNVIDFKDRNTQECLFKEYWDIIKGDEGLTMDDVHYAIEKKEKKKNKNKKKKNKIIRKRGLVSGKLSDDDEDCVIFNEDEDDEDEKESPVARRKRKGLKPERDYTESHKKSHKKKSRSQGLEFCGWASKPLIEFLESIGKDTTIPLSLENVDHIIKAYIKKEKLIDPEKKRQVRCDEKLFSVFKKRKFKRSRVYYLLESHFFENRTGENSEEHDDDVCDEMEDESLDEKSEAETIPRLTGFASIVSENIKLVYLRKSLVEELFKLEPENFQEKVVGSFIRIKSDAKDRLQDNSHRLLPVTGVVESLPGNILLEASSMQKPVSVDMLLDSDFTEEEILDLQEKIRNGVLKNLPTVELEKKARSLHEDITKHWIKRELGLLQRRIDYANEKGRRRELCEYVDQREQLETQWYQEELLHTLPRVIPDYEIDDIDQ